MSMLPTTTVKGNDSTDDNERKKHPHPHPPLRDMIADLLRHYSTVELDMKYCNVSRPSAHAQLDSAFVPR